MRLPPPPAPLPLASPALFFDLDGTLAALRPRPEQVEVPVARIVLLQRLSLRLDGAVAIVSGRSIGQIDALLAPLRLPVAGLHGGELRLPDGRYHTFEPPSHARTAVRDACLALALPAGAWVEEKAGICFALHYREEPAAGGMLLDAARQIAAASKGEYAVQCGDCVVELKPAAHDKGSALRHLMRAAPFLGRSPVAIGDDLTDEHAFAACQAASGLAVIIGDRAPTCADYRLDSPLALHDWLAAMVGAHRGDDGHRSGPQGVA